MSHYKLDSEQHADNIVYVRSVNATELPEVIRAIDAKILYAVRSEGERLALVRERDMAFVLARQNDLAPVAVH